MKLVKKVKDEQFEAWDPKEGKSTLPESFKEFTNDNRLIFFSENTGAVLNKNRVKRYSEYTPQHIESIIGSDSKFNENDVLILVSKPYKRLMIVGRDTVEKTYEVVDDQKVSNQEIDKSKLLFTIVNDYAENGNHVEKKISKEIINNQLSYDNFTNDINKSVSFLQYLVESGDRSSSATSRKILAKYNDMIHIINMMNN